MSNSEIIKQPHNASQCVESPVICVGCVHQSSSDSDPSYHCSLSLQGTERRCQMDKRVTIQFDCYLNVRVIIININSIREEWRNAKRGAALTKRLAGSEPRRPRLAYTTCVFVPSPLLHSVYLRTFGFGLPAHMPAALHCLSTWRFFFASHVLTLPRNNLADLVQFLHLYFYINIINFSINHQSPSPALMHANI